MHRKPHPKTAARKVSEHLSSMGITVSDRQSKDIVAIVEGYKNWQTFKASEGISVARATTTAYEKVWSAVADDILEHLGTVLKAIRSYFGPHTWAKGYQLHPPVVDTQGDEWSASITVTDAQGKFVCSLALSLVEDDENSQGAFSVRQELVARGSEEMDEPRVLISEFATSRFTTSAWLSASQADSLARQVHDGFSASQVVYAIENERLFR